MKVHTQPHGNVTVLVPHGPLVADELIDLRRAVESATASKAKRGFTANCSPDTSTPDPRSAARNPQSPDSEAPGPLFPKRVVLDLADVPYLDSSGIELLLELCGVQVAPHQRPKLAALSETCLEALELTSILTRLEVFDTVENALRSCQR